GISWGGKLALALEMRHSGLIQGLALLCPGLYPRVRSPFIERIKIGLSGIINPTRYFPIPLSDPELFTQSRKWQEFIRTDPLSLREATARLMVASVRLDYQLRRSAAQIKVPVLLLLAGRDRIIDNVKTRRFVETLASTDKEIVEYREAAH